MAEDLRVPLPFRGSPRRTGLAQADSVPGAAPHEAQGTGRALDLEACAPHLAVPERSVERARERLAADHRAAARDPHHVASLAPEEPEGVDPHGRGRRVPSREFPAGDPAEERLGDRDLPGRYRATRVGDGGGRGVQDANARSTTAARAAGGRRIVGNLRGSYRTVGNGVRMSKERRRCASRSDASTASGVSPRAKRNPR